MNTIKYYEAVEQRFGSHQATQDFLWLSMNLGMEHRGIRNGPGITQSGFDLLTALEQLIEEGEAPARPKTTKTDSTDSLLWTRPVCPYPQRAICIGEDDVDEASNFECAASE